MHTIRPGGVPVAGEPSCGRFARFGNVLQGVMGWVAPGGSKAEVVSTAVANELADLGLAASRVRDRDSGDCN